jgi:CubicO group peptidase (beta-lactamase class C family)
MFCMANSLCININTAFMKNQTILRRIPILFFFLIPLLVSGQGTFPSEHWVLCTNPEKYGFDKEKLQKAEKYANDSLKTAAVMIIKDGTLVYQWGDVSGKYATHSCRKSFLSALYGKYVDNGQINLDATMAELGIDDVPPLSDQEKQATVRDCLKARSGVYHTAHAETEGMHAQKPPANSLKPGTYWIYNNWDFNVLGTIFEKFAGKSVYRALKEDIGDPIGMEDFVPQLDSLPITGDRSIHAAYMFSISARDMARFGLLMLRNGRWGDKQVIPEWWVKESTSYFSDATAYRRDGYGYMWWVAKKHNRFPDFPNVDVPEGTFSARGAGGHFIVVFPDYNLVVVHRVNTWEDGNNVSEANFGKLLSKILDARIAQ